MFISDDLDISPGIGRANGKSLRAGSSAYARFVQTVLWYEQCRADKQSTVQQVVPFGTTTGVVHTNRTLALRKNRNANGGGMKLMFDFDRRA